MTFDRRVPEMRLLMVGEAVLRCSPAFLFVFGLCKFTSQEAARGVAFASGCRGTRASG